MKASDIKPGCKIHRFTVESFSHKDKRHRKWWNCRCDCGTTKIVHGSAIVSGNTRSCGCLAREVKARTRKPKNGSEVTAIILGYKRHAENRGFRWILSRGQVESIVSRPCSYCGIPPSNIKKTRHSLPGGFRYSGVDRIDSTKDYTVENVTPACKICNFAKSNMTKKEFHDWAKRLASMASQWGDL